MHELRYTAAVTRRAVRRTVLRRFGPVYFVTLLFMAIFIASGLAQGERDWIYGAGVTVVLLGTIMPIAAIRAHTRAAISRLMQLDDGKASIDLTGGRLRLESKLGAMDLPLSTVTMVWRYPDAWILLSGHNFLMTLPTEGVRAEDLATWDNALRDAGARFG